MHAVIADADLCYPATSGKRLRTLHLMSRLARRHEITYVCRCDALDDETEKARAYLAGHGIEVILVEQARSRKSGPLFYARLAANILSPLPYSVASHAGRRISAALRSLVAGRHVDLWQFEWPAYALALQDFTGARTVIATHNVESLIWQRYYETEPSVIKRWYIKGQWHKYERFERRIYADATRVVTCTEEDAVIVRGSFGVPNVDVVENGMDKDYFDAVADVPREPKQILFLGALDYRPNVDALKLLLERIFPAVRTREPEARLCIVGRNPALALRQRAAATPNVELHANVPDVRPFLARAGVMAVPLRIGGGSRLKILEALAAGLPVVSTRVGAEGLELGDGQELDLVDDVERMADRLVEVICYPARARALAQRGRRLVRERYDWDVLADKLEQVWERCREAPASAMSVKPRTTEVTT
jgi:glycosyltransferase involved in cell wall biosynthesis